MSLRSEMRADARRYGDASLLASMRHPGLRMTTKWRVARHLRDHNIPALPQLLRQRILTSYNCDISLDAMLAPGLRIPHPVGIVIGDDVEAAHGVTIMQNVTLGGNASAIAAGRQTPQLGIGAFIGPGSVVVGPVRIGENARVKANQVVQHDVDKFGRVERLTND